MYYNKALGFEIYLFFVPTFMLGFLKSLEVDLVYIVCTLYIVQTKLSELSQIFQIVLNLLKWV